MTNAALMPFVLPRQFTLDGQLLSGGKIYTYKSGTNVPKVTYATADRSVINTNPVILDAAGFAPIFLDVGAYTILVQDSNGVQIEYPIDGVVGAGGSFLGGDESVTLASVIAVETYNDLRNLINTYDIVLVAGKDQVGDGGQGIFAHQPSATAYDDDGITLSTTAGVVYLREFDGVINPQWYGLLYGGSSDQTNTVLKCQSASAHYGFPVDYAGAVYIASNLTIPANTAMICSFGGAFTTGNTAVTMTFAAGAKFSSSANSVFGAKCQPIFNTGCVDAIKLSWMGGTTGDDKIAKWVASSTVSYKVLLDTNLSTATSFTIPSNMTLQVASGVITVTGAIVININNIDYAGYSKFINYTNYTYATSLRIYPSIKPEWIGAVGDGVADDGAPVSIALNSGNVILSTARTYKVLRNLTFTNLLLSGGGTLNISTYTMTGTSLALDGITISQSASRSNESVICTVTSSTTTGQLGFTTGFPISITAGTRYIINTQNEILVAQSNSAGTVLNTGKDWALLGTNYWVGKTVQCVSDVDISAWVSVNTFTAINSTINSAISATNLIVDGCTFTNLSSMPTYEEPYLRHPKIPLLPNATALATNRAGEIIDIGKTITFVSGTDYTVTCNGSGWTNGIGFSTVTITPLTTNTAILHVAIQFNAGGVPPVSATVNYADIDITAINNTLKTWINNLGTGLMGTVDYIERYDNAQNYACNVPAGVWRAGAHAWTFVGPKGINGALTSSLFTPNPWLGWGDIWPSATYTNPTQIRHGIGFSQLITIPNAQ